MKITCAAAFWISQRHLTVHYDNHVTSHDKREEGFDLSNEKTCSETEKTWLAEPSWCPDTITTCSHEMTINTQIMDVILQNVQSLEGTVSMCKVGCEWQRFPAVAQNLMLCCGFTSSVLMSLFILQIFNKLLHRWKTKHSVLWIIYLGAGDVPRNVNSGHALQYVQEFAHSDTVGDVVHVIFAPQDSS